jgi:hypothetical protein
VGLVESLTSWRLRIRDELDLGNIDEVNLNEKALQAPVMNELYTNASENPMALTIAENWSSSFWRRSNLDNELA